MESWQASPVGGSSRLQPQSVCEKAVSTLNVGLVWALPAVESSDYAERSALRAPDRPMYLGKSRKVQDQCHGMRSKERWQ